MMKRLLLLLLICLSARAEDFDDWKKRIAKKYHSKNLPSAFIEKQLEDVDFNGEVIERDRNQITSNEDIIFPEWIERWKKSDPVRIDRGRELLKKHRKLLQKVEKKYNVDKEVIVSLWGVETLYGNITGDYSVIEVLATLAFDKRRRRFFERELVAALKIIKQGHIELEDFKGSWAGATGQCQFMPSSFLMYAQDFDGDGKKDIWNNKADLFASIAYYLKRARWKKGKAIGALAVSSKAKNINVDRRRSAHQWSKLGYRRLDGKKLRGKWRRKAERIPFQQSPLVLRGSNYKAIMRWNRSSLFAALNIILIEQFKS